MPRKHGFTLIELLIVVAIIAILAAIAVPNFLEAQVRSKISRTKADMRTILLAAESYRIDNNGYMLDNIRKPWTSSGALQPDSSTWDTLTTPIAYMSSIPQSPFREFKTIANGYGKTYSSGSTDGNYGNYLEYWAGNWNGPGNTYMITAGSRETGIFWRAVSVGPDNLSDFHNQYGTQPNQSFSPYDVQKRAPRLVNCIYDPTNGTTSKGDFFISNQGLVM